MKFRVLRGQHIQNTDTGKKNANGGPVFEDRIYPTGSVVETDVDLLQLNGQGMTPKFERLDFSGRMTHPAGEVWDPTAETLDQFADRMRAREGEQRFQSTQPQRTGRVEQAPSVSQTSPTAAAGFEGGVSHVPSPAPGQAVSPGSPPPSTQPHHEPPSPQPPAPYAAHQPLEGKPLKPDQQPQQTPIEHQRTPAQKEAAAQTTTSPPPGVLPGSFPPKSEAEMMRQLQGMTVKQLQDLAASEEIDLKGATNKDAIIKNIRTALKD